MTTKKRSLRICSGFCSMASPLMQSEKVAVGVRSVETKICEYVQALG